MSKRRRTHLVKEAKIAAGSPTENRKSQRRRCPSVFYLTDEGTLTSHFLMFVSKRIRGYEIMKEVMAKQRSKADQQVPSFS